MKFPIYQTMLIVWILFTWGEGVWAQQVPPELIAYPDLIIYNGKIVSMDDASFNTSPGKTFEAMAVRGDRIQFLGSNEAVLPYAGPQTRKLDLKGRTVIPGLINTHSHMHDHSVQLWTRNHAQEVEKLFKRFSVSGNSFEELTRGIEVVIKENMAHSEPGQWAWINLPTGGSSGDRCRAPHPACPARSARRRRRGVRAQPRPARHRGWSPESTFRHRRLHRA